ncbi:MAG: hypothetical protein KAR32_04910 [Candidatus Omnitrophica bacterium]|nr:hypothetical protein [Candidatus Omnitrophota bacterium]
MSRKSLFLFVVICGFLVCPTHSCAEPIQLFLDTSSEAVVRFPLEVEILVLNENGEVETGFKGKHELHITVHESGMRDESYSLRSKKARFKKGKASFTIENSEDETVDVTVGLVDPPVSGQISLTFLDKDIFPPEITDIFEETPGILKLEFNEELEEESAQKLKNYKAVTNEREAYPVKIEYHRTYVFLEFEEHFLTDEEGYLELEGIRDLNGNEISSGLKSPDFEGTCEDACPD